MFERSCRDAYFSLALVDILRDLAARCLFEGSLLRERTRLSVFRYSVDLNDVVEPFVGAPEMDFVSKWLWGRVALVRSLS